MILVVIRHLSGRFTVVPFLGTINSMYIYIDVSVYVEFVIVYALTRAV